MPEKSNIETTTGYENYLNLASYKVSDFDTVVSENEHLIPSFALNLLIKKGDRMMGPLSRECACL